MMIPGDGTYSYMTRSYAPSGEDVFRGLPVSASRSMIHSPPSGIFSKLPSGGPKFTFGGISVAVSVGVAVAVEVLVGVDVAVAVAVDVAVAVFSGGGGMVAVGGMYSHLVAVGAAVGAAVVCMMTGVVGEICSVGSGVVGGTGVFLGSFC